MDKSAKTFPRDVAHLPHKNQSNNLDKKHRITGYVVDIGGENPFVNFRQQYYQIERKRVLDGVKQDKVNNKKYITQKTRNSMVNIPTGSFNRGFGVAGNSTYPSWINNSGFNRNVKGGFRTQEGQEYGQMLLRKRAEQFDALRALKEGIPEIGTDTPQIQPLEPDDANKVAIDLMISSIQDNFQEGSYDEIKTDELRKLFNALKSYGFQIPKQDLNSYVKSFNYIVENIDTLEGEMGDRRLDIDDFKKANRVAVRRIEKLLEALLASYEYSPKEQKSYLSTAVKMINKITPKRKDITLPPPPTAPSASATTGAVVYSYDDYDEVVEAIEEIEDGSVDTFGEIRVIARGIKTFITSASLSVKRAIRSRWIDAIDDTGLTAPEKQSLINLAGFRRS